MSALPASDLRSEAKAYKRDKNHASKWARGARVAPGKQCPHNFSWNANGACRDCAARPLHRDGARNHSAHSYQRAEKISSYTQGHRQGSIAKKVLQNDLLEITQTSDAGSSDEEMADTSAAPLPDAGVMYSYDAQSGPTSGNDILSNAVMQAVKRFENKQTEQLIKTEYDLVLDGKEAEDPYAGDVEDDFEVVEFEHLR